MALKGHDKRLRERFTKKHSINEKANLKKYETIRLAVEGVARQVMEVLPDDFGSQEPILGSLLSVVDTACKVFEKRSAGAVTVAPKTRAKSGNLLRTMPLRTEANPAGASTPVPDAPAPDAQTLANDTSGSDLAVH